jgi:hypothetical protein
MSNTNNTPPKHPNRRTNGRGTNNTAVEQQQRKLPTAFTTTQHAKESITKTHEKTKNYGWVQINAGFTHKQASPSPQLLLHYH